MKSLWKKYDDVVNGISKDKGSLSESKIDNIKHLKYFVDLLEPILKKYKIDVLFADKNKQKNQHNMLFLRGGSPIYSLFLLTPGGEYINYNPFYHLWKNSEIDYDIVDKIKVYDTNRYKQPEDKPELPDSYDLFPLQLSNHLYGSGMHPSQIDISRDDSRWFFNKEMSMVGKNPISHEAFKRSFKNIFNPMRADEWATRDAISYVTKNKRHTVFKAGHLDKCIEWSDFVKEGITNEYTIYLDGNMDYMLERANVVYSSDSLTSFQALLLDKPVATYYPINISEVVPIIQTASDIENLKPIDQETKMRFLSWWYHKLHIDIYNDDAEEKIDNIVRRFVNGERTQEIFG